MYFRSFYQNSLHANAKIRRSAENREHTRIAEDSLSGFGDDFIRKDAQWLEQHREI